MISVLLDGKGGARLGITEHHREQAFRLLGFLEHAASHGVRGANEMLTSYQYTLECLTQRLPADPEHP